MKKQMFYSVFSMLITLLFLMGNSQDAQAQLGTANGFDKNHHFGIAAGVGSGAAYSLGWTHFYGIGKNKNFRVGYGLRYTGYSGKNKNYITAPFNLTKEGDAFLDTLSMSKAGMSNIAINLNLKLRVKEKYEVGFNIDALGVTFGGEKDGIFYSSDDDALNATTQAAKPTPVTLLLIGDNDRGMINSEFWLGYFLNDNFQARVGYNYLFSEYTTNNTLTNDNDRFRHKAGLIFVGINWIPNRN